MAAALVDHWSATGKKNRPRERERERGKENEHQMAVTLKNQSVTVTGI